VARGTDQAAAAQELAAQAAVGQGPAGGGSSATIDGVFSMLVKSPQGRSTSHCFPESNPTLADQPDQEFPSPRRERARHISLTPHHPSSPAREISFGRPNSGPH